MLHITITKDNEVICDEDAKVIIAGLSLSAEEGHNLAYCNDASTVELGIALDCVEKEITSLKEKFPEVNVIRELIKTEKLMESVPELKELLAKFGKEEEEKENADTENN